MTPITPRTGSHESPAWVHAYTTALSELQEILGSRRPARGHAYLSQILGFVMQRQIERGTYYF
jgi:hypothetical protein